MQPRISVDERQVLTLRWRDIKAAERRTKHVPPRIGFAAKSRLDAGKCVAETVHRHLVWGRVRSILEGVQELVKLIASQFKTHEWPTDSRTGERLNESEAWIAMRQEHVALRGRQVDHGSVAAGSVCGRH